MGKKEARSAFWGGFFPSLEGMFFPYFITILSQRNGLDLGI